MLSDYLYNMNEQTVKRKTWTPQEEEILKANYTVKSPEELQDQFQLPWATIKCKAFKLGLNRQKVVCDEQAIVTDQKAGMAMQDITTKHNITNQTYYQLLEKYGLEKKNHNLNNINIEEFTKDWAELPMPELVEKYKVSRPTLHAKGKELSLTRPEKFLYKQSTLNIEQLKIDYLDNNLTSDQLAKKYLENENSRSHISRVLRKAGIIKDRAIIQQQKEKTCLEKYGVKNPAESQEVQDKAKITCLEKYGVEYLGNATEVKEKIKATCLEKYGSVSPLGNKEVQDKVKSTCLEKYGVEYPGNATEVREKIADTCLEKYGSVSPFGNKEVQQKSIATFMEKYGTTHPNNCYGKTEKEIGEWLKEVSGKEFITDRSILDGKEIDLYNEELKLGIEYCGLYWHNEHSPEPRLRMYHYDKYKAALDKGIRLITIFEDEWNNRPQQVQSFLTSVIKKPLKNCVYARKCTIKLIDKVQANQFYNQYHIQGKAVLIVHAAGLFFKDELVAVMSFGKHHRDTTKTVLDRLTFKTDWHISGGASRLFKFLLGVSGATSILSWSDNRWNVGNVYQHLGFVLETDMAPDYSYVDSNNPGVRKSKQSQKKGLTNCPPELTEKEWSVQNGLYRVWDCGKKRWIWNQPKTETI